jgi:hypothetical protein
VLIGSTHGKQLPVPFVICDNAEAELCFWVVVKVHPVNGLVEVYGKAGTGSSKLRAQQNQKQDKWNCSFHHLHPFAGFALKDSKRAGNAFFSQVDSVGL